ncbi:putative signal peptide protein [Puccinia sorghi]|uniref:Putative signal peptide protein n=1 Tax=Puccinia sorghi TaxID=27349 RepID=A0A0L6VAQ2_9BASI|nr:putative signal peptide protein [Puccinia sorghi]
MTGNLRHTLKNQCMLIDLTLVLLSGRYELSRAEIPWKMDKRSSLKKLMDHTISTKIGTYSRPHLHHFNPLCAQCSTAKFRIIKASLGLMERLMTNTVFFFCAWILAGLIPPPWIPFCSSASCGEFSLFIFFLTHQSRRSLPLINHLCLTFPHLISHTFQHLPKAGLHFDTMAAQWYHQKVCLRIYAKSSVLCSHKSLPALRGPFGPQVQPRGLWIGASFGGDTRVGLTAPFFMQYKYDKLGTPSSILAFWLRSSVVSVLISVITVITWLAGLIGTMASGLHYSLVLSGNSFFFRLCIMPIVPLANIGDEAYSPFRLNNILTINVLRLFIIIAISIVYPLAIQVRVREEGWVYREIQ